MDNGLCLCPLHHKAFDLGAIGLTGERRIAVSSRLHGGDAVEGYIGGFHGRELQGPLHRQKPVRVEYQRWHWENVFRAPAR